MSPIHVHATAEGHSGARQHGGRKERSSWFGNHVLASMKLARNETAQTKKKNDQKDGSWEGMVEKDEKEWYHREVAKEQAAETNCFARD